MIYTLGTDERRRDMIISAMGSKWELTFTTLVTFGGALASFPLFLFHEFRRCLLALDSHPVQFRASGSEL